MPSSQSTSLSPHKSAFSSQDSIHKSRTILPPTGKKAIPHDIDTGENSKIVSDFVSLLFSVYNRKSGNLGQIMQYYRMFYKEHPAPVVMALLDYQERHSVPHEIISLFVHEFDPDVTRFVKLLHQTAFKGPAKSFNQKPESVLNLTAHILKGFESLQLISFLSYIHSSLKEMVGICSKTRHATAALFKVLILLGHRPVYDGLDDVVRRNFIDAFSRTLDLFAMNAFKGLDSLPVPRLSQHLKGNSIVGESGDFGPIRKSAAALLLLWQQICECLSRFDRASHS